MCANKKMKTTENTKDDTDDPDNMHMELYLAIWFRMLVWSLGLCCYARLRIVIRMGVWCQTSLNRRDRNTRVEMATHKVSQKNHRK